MTIRSITFAMSIVLLSTASIAADLPPPPVVMTGEAEVSAAPDQAVVSASVITEAKTANGAVAANSTKMNRVFDALKKLDVPDSGISTTGFSLEPQYPPYNEKNPQPHVITGYHVSNSISVTLYDVTRAGAVLDALLDAGANESAGVSFGIKDPGPLLKQARAKAAKDALDRAETYADAVGATLGPVLSIREGNSVEPVNRLEQVVVTASRQATPIQAGQQTISASVTVAWALK